MISLIVSLASYISLKDIECFRIPNVFVCIIALCGFIEKGFVNLYSILFLLTFSFLFHYIPKTPKIGKGDIKYITSVGFFIPISYLSLFCIVTGMSAIIISYYFCNKNNSKFLPFAPSISFGLISVILLAG